MKKTLFAAAVLLALVSAAYCKPEDVPVDVYDDGSSPVQQEKEDKKTGNGKTETKIKWNTKANREAAMQGDPYNKKKMIGNRDFADRLLNINKYTKIEPFTVYLRPTVGKMFVRKANLIYREGTDVAGFEMYYDTSAYALQFATDARRVLREAVKSYFKDFDERRLDRSASARKTRSVYGFCEGYEDFGIVSGMMTNYCRPKVFFGYVFIKNTPYFTVNVQKSKNLAVEDSKSEEATLKAEVIEQTYYMTKAQANKLMVFLTDENIGALQAASTMAEDVYQNDAYDDAELAEPPEPVDPEKAVKPVEPAQPANEAEPKNEAEPAQPAAE